MPATDRDKRLRQRLLIVPPPAAIGHLLAVDLDALDAETAEARTVDERDSRPVHVYQVGDVGAERATGRSGCGRRRILVTQVGEVALGFETGARDGVEEVEGGVGPAGGGAAGLAVE